MLVFVARATSYNVVCSCVSILLGTHSWHLAADHACLMHSIGTHHAVWSPMGKLYMSSSMNLQKLFLVVCTFSSQMSANTECIFSAALCLLCKCHPVTLHIFPCIFHTLSTLCIQCFLNTIPKRNLFYSNIICLFCNFIPFHYNKYCSSWQATIILSPCICIYHLFYLI